MALHNRSHLLKGAMHYAVHGISLAGMPGPEGKGRGSFVFAYINREQFDWLASMEV